MRRRLSERDRERERATGAYTERETIIVDSANSLINDGCLRRRLPFWGPQHHTHRSL